MTDAPRMRTGRSVWRDAAWLVLFCAAIYLFGLTSHGLTNWQESQRALVAREMFERGEWIVPTVHGQAYIAKPPLIYWIQMVIAHAERSLGIEPFTGEFEIRLTVALGGIAGVLATYFGARSMFRGVMGRGVARAMAPLSAADERTGQDAAWYAALGLASGVLYVRSSRIGELDVLIVPFAICAIAAVVAAWRRRVEMGGVHAPALALATLASSAAVMTKGPPALLVIALGGYGSILLLSAQRAGALSVRDVGGDRAALLGGLVGSIGMCGLALAMDDRVSSVWHGLGLVFFTVVGAVLGWFVVRLAGRQARSAWWRAIAGTHPWFVLGIPVAIGWRWQSEVASRIGQEALAALASAEIEDNLRVLVLDSPTKNLGFMIYGIAPMSIIALIGVWSLVRQRRWGAAGERVPLVWCGLSFASFSALGKGVARYLTPTWPGVAMVGGLWLAMCERDRVRRGTPPVAKWAGVVFVVSGLFQGWWYGVGREVWYASRSPRDVVRELLPQIDVSRLGVWVLADPAIDFYAGERVEQWGGRGQPDLDDLAATVRGGSGAYVLLAAADASASREDDTPLTVALRRAGLELRPIETGSRYTWRADGTPVVVWSISAGSMPAESAIR